MYSVVILQISWILFQANLFDFTVTIFSYTVYLEVPTYSLESMLSELGGTLGLWLGLSMIPFAHLFFFLMNEVWNKVTSRNKVNST